MFNGHQEALFRLIKPEEIIDLDRLLLQLMKGNTKVMIAADVLSCLRDAATYTHTITGDVGSPADLKTMLDGLKPISRQNKTIETIHDELPDGGIDIYRSSCTACATGNLQTIVNLTWLPDTDGQTALRVASETANGTRVWEYRGAWTIGELARWILHH